MSRQGFGSEVTYIVLWFVFLSLFGLSTGYLLLSYLFGSISYIVWLLYRLRQLNIWLDNGAKGEMPHLSGVVGAIGDYIFRQQTFNERTKANYRGQVKRIKSLTNSLAEGVIVLNKNKEIDWWNPAAAAMLKLVKDDAKRPIQNLLRSPEFIAFLQNKNYSTPLELTSPYNEQQTMLFTAATFGKGDTVLIVTDISRLRQLEKIREDFVANLAHEIKTPLTVLTGYIETLQDSGQEKPKGWDRALSQMASQAERMNNLAKDLVTLSELETKQNTPDISRVDLYPLLSQIVDDAKILSQEKHNITLEDFDHSLALQGNSKELYSAISNLVFNAVRHNPEGTDITLSVKDISQGCININVSDNGVGIDAKFLPRLTERFYRVDNSRNSGTGGTGLGLAIVKHVLARYQGKLVIQSVPHKGSTFSCQFQQH